MSSTALGLSSLAGMAYVTLRGSRSVSMMPIVGISLAVASRRAWRFRVGLRRTSRSGLNASGLVARAWSRSPLDDALDEVAGISHQPKTSRAFEMVPGSHFVTPKPLSPRRLALSHTARSAPLRLPTNRTRPSRSTTPLTTWAARRRAGRVWRRSMYETPVRVPYTSGRAARCVLAGE